MHARQPDVPESSNSMIDSMSDEVKTQGQPQTMRQAKTELHEFLTHTRLRIRAIAQSVAEFNAIADAKAVARQQAEQDELEHLRRIAEEKSTFDQNARTQPRVSDAGAGSSNPVGSRIDDDPRDGGDVRETQIEEILHDRAASQVSPNVSAVIAESLAVTSVLQEEDGVPSMVDPAIARQELATSSPLTSDGVDPLERLNAIKQRLAKQIENS
ncbi:MAG: hypothetical protein ACR2NZ_10585 [Rubripirellula sp.]